MIFHKQYGSQGPALVVIHGLFGNADNWHTLAQSWADTFTVYCLDLPNHGRSDTLSPLDYPLLAQQVASWVDAQQLSQCFLLGHSMGGKVAMQFAHDHPNRVTKLIVADIAPVTYQGSHQQIFAGLHAIDAAKPTTRQQADAILADYEDNRGVRQFLLKSLVREQDHLRIGINYPALEQDYKQILNAPSFARPIEIPTLFIKGEHSNYILPEYADVTQRWFHNIQVKIIPGTGHWLHAEKPQVFGSLVKRFLTT
ncbi:alpha/beta fold hydrolase [Maribrevibacterium harenarium]|uniref:Alpha/beta fold hydrolase n=1 Tax=Maribrevibacterium harenarium TaxID=2589817 RepID=A0A501X222_9GAMM|nr:alpha/beta fold hydrolase [Maribrevibacterium harenarium]TPE54526.1 alpha/beta fold hydrolase [Maribrevibacterium harenarium]